jgi:hypothetical protein
MARTLSDYFRCPSGAVQVELSGPLSGESGFFRFGREAVCYGRRAGGSPSPLTHDLQDVSTAVTVENERLLWPFDFSEVVENLRHERYGLDSRQSSERFVETRSSRRAYYFLRPILSVPVRKRLQRIYLRGWRKITFPRWPVDVTVDSLMQQVLTLALRARPNEKIPFIWFWPDGAPCCGMMTHDVEHPTGLNFCSDLMAIDDSYGIKSSFQIIPEGRYEVGRKFLENLTKSGCEINVHDLNHDGSLFRDKREFLRRAALINQYGKMFRTRGFRSGQMYRNQSWYDALDFSYDMSVPNVAHLEPQRGGCCTVMPFFIGKILELPLTTVQDYSLFHILGDYSIDMWRRQIDLIRAKNGLISFITHPDYLVEARARGVYLDLLKYLSRLRDEEKLWMALPSEVDRWWRNRHQMRLVQHRGRWRIEGPGKGRARIAYASLKDDALVYTIEP